MAYFTVYIPRNAEKIKEVLDEIVKGSQDLFGSKADVILDKEGGLSVTVPYETLPDRQDARILLAHVDAYLGKAGISEYLVMFGVERVNINGLFFKFAQGEPVNGDIEKELDKVFE